LKGDIFVYVLLTRHSSGNTEEIQQRPQLLARLILLPPNVSAKLYRRINLLWQFCC